MSSEKRTQKSAELAQTSFSEVCKKRTSLILHIINVLVLIGKKLVSHLSAHSAAPYFTF